MTGLEAGRQMPHITATEVLDRTGLYLTHFELAVDPAEDPAQFVAAVDELNPRFKGERTLVRFELEKDTTEFPAATKGIILETAVALEMLKHETPLVGEFDVIAALGAARRAPYDRIKYAVQAVKSEAASGRVVAVANTRDLVPGEAEAAAAFIPAGAETEADLVRGAAAKVSEEEDVEIPVIVTDHPKADTETTVSTMMEQFGQDRLARVGAVTTQIYWAKTELDMARFGRRYGTDTAVAGNPSEPAIVGNRTMATYHSEILSTLYAVGRTFAAK
jgi:hypothetical protein